MGSQKDGITMCSTHSGVILIERCCGRKVGTRIRRYSDEERFEWSSPVLPLTLVLAADLFAACSLLTDKSRRFIL